MPDYNLIAKTYDSLSRLVFGKAQVRAQVDLLSAIPARASILLVGGGTGWILEEIAKVHSSGLQVNCVDSASEMIALAGKRDFGNNKVTFVEADILAFKCKDHFDLIITPFLFDNFSENLAEAAFEKMHDMLKPGGLWLYVDFFISKKGAHWWQRVLLRSMYLFFKITAGVHAASMPEMAPLFTGNRYQKNLRRTYYKGFIESVIFQKSDDRGAVPSE